MLRDGVRIKRNKLLTKFEGAMQSNLGDVIDVMYTLLWLRTHVRAYKVYCGYRYILVDIGKANSSP